MAAPNNPLDNPLRINAAGNVSMIDENFLKTLKRIRPRTEPAEPQPAVPEAGSSSEPATSSSRANPPASISAIAPLYLGSIAEGNTRGFSFNRQLRTMGDANPIARDQWIQNGQAFLDFMQGTGKTYGIAVNNRRQMMTGRWGAWIYYAHPDLPSEAYWLKDTVTGNWKLFFLALVSKGKGKSGEDQSTIRSTTLQQWALTFVWLVGNRTTDENGQHVGLRLLQGEGLFAEIQAHIAMLTHELGLARHAADRTFIGRAELLLMIQAGFEDSEEYGRIPFQQILVAMNLFSFLGIRTGSLGFSNPKYRDMGHYTKMGDLKVERTGYCEWVLYLDIKYRKCYNITIDGQTQKFRMDPVTKVHNVLFDAGMNMLLFLLMREALVDCNTLQDVIDYDKQWFVIKPEMRDQPLFLERTPGGHRLGTAPASGEGLSKSAQRLGDKVNIDGVTAHSMRRETGNKVGLVMGADMGQMLLGHEEAQSTFNISYSHSTLNIPVTAIALGELDHTAPAANQLALQRLNRSEVAAMALLKTRAFQKAIEPSEPEQEESESLDIPPPKKRKVIKLSPEQEAEAHPDIVKMSEQIDGLYDQIYSKLPAAAKSTHPSRVTNTIYLMYKAYQNDPIFQENATELAQLKTSLCELASKKSRRAQTIKGPMRTKNKKQSASTSMNPTTEELDEAVKDVSHLVNSDSNLPKVDAKTSVLGLLDIRKSEFGKNFLTPACQQLLSSPDLVRQLEQEEADDKTNLEEQIANEDAQDDPEATNVLDTNGVDIQKSLAPFSDKNEIQVINADVAEVKINVMTALYRPVVVSAMEKRLVEEYGGKWPCLLCIKLPEEVKRSYRITQDLFVDKRALTQHQRQHSRWFLLMQYMFTEDASVFKCPLKSCSYRGDSIPEIEDHCLDDCNGRETFQKLKDAHDNRQGPGASASQSLLDAKLRARLAGPGVPVKPWEVERARWWSDLTEDKLQYLESMNVVEPDRLRACAPEIEDMMRTALEGYSESEGVLRDETATESFEDIEKEVLTEDQWARFEADVERHLALLDLED